jgi:hypothetical protein
VKKLFVLMMTGLFCAAIVTAPIGCGDKKTETKKETTTKETPDKKETTTKEESTTKK